MGYGDLFMLWRDYGSFSEDTLRIYGAEIAFAIGYSFINSFLNFRMIILILTNIYIYHTVWFRKNWKNQITKKDYRETKKNS